MKPISASRRVHVLIVLMTVWSAAIGVRLYFLHVVHSADYREKAERQQQHTLGITPRRGVIYDRNGAELAISVQVDSVFAVPREIKNPAATAKLLSRLTGVKAAELLEKFKPGRHFVWVKRK